MASVGDGTDGLVSPGSSTDALLEVMENIKLNNSDDSEVATKSKTANEDGSDNASVPSNDLPNLSVDENYIGTPEPPTLILSMPVTGESSAEIHATLPTVASYGVLGESARASLKSVDPDSQSQLVMSDDAFSELNFDQEVVNADEVSLGTSSNNWITGLPELGAPGSHEHDNSNDLETFLSKSKHYIILSSAGKPIYSMHGSDELVTGYTGIIQAIVSFFQSGGSGDGEDGEKLRSFRANKTLFVVSIEGPLILVAIDKLGQSESQLRAQLDVLYAQVLSTLTKGQINKVFEQHKNFDLRQLLGGTEVFMNALTKQMTYGSPSILLSALECLKLRKSFRDKINSVLIDCRTPSLLYGLIVADSRLVSVIRPRRHSLHPPDLTLLFSMLFNTTSFSSGEHWAPICLPRFNNSGYLYAYINFFVKDVALVLISPDRNAFFEMRESASKIVESLQKKHLVDAIDKAVSIGRFRTMDIPAPLVRHFLYKSKNNVQFVMPSFDLHFPDKEDQYRLMALYHQIHREVHNKANQVKVLYTVRHSTTALAWVTGSFEMYCVTGLSPKEAISQSVRTVVSWIKQQEERLFIVGGAVF